MAMPEPDVNSSNSDVYWLDNQTTGEYLIYKYVDNDGFALISSLPLQGQQDLTRGLFAGDHFYLCQGNAVSVRDSSNFEKIKLLTVN
jgi:hypothetical protein